ncbi:hypothetical protein ACNKHR_00905 [Shigella flexneri]
MKTQDQILNTLVNLR